MTLDALAAVAMALLVLNGMIWQATLIPVAFLGIPWLRRTMTPQPERSGEQDDMVIFLGPGKITRSPTRHAPRSCRRKEPITAGYRGDGNGL